MPGNYVPPTGEPLLQAPPQPYNLARVYNDKLLGTITDFHSNPILMVRGFNSSATNCRIVRVADGMELLDCGSLAQAMALAQALVAAWDFLTSILTTDLDIQVTDDLGAGVRL